MDISIIGLGKLGASMAAAIGSKGHNVIGVDILEESVNAVRAGNAPVQETDLQEWISKYSDNITATLSHEEAVLHSDISFVIVPTPSDPDGSFTTRYAESAFGYLGEALKEKDDYHLFVLTSTVLPGACRANIIPVIEQKSGKKCGVDFGFCYSPEFIALGSVIKDFLHPDFTLVGEFDKASGDLLEEAYSQIMNNNPDCERMSIENAELTKVSLNSFVTTKIAFANMLAEVCEQLPGGDIDVVSQALGKDTRIGKKYLKGGLGFGGPCFPRDNVALRFLMDQVGVKTDLPLAVHEMNQKVPTRVVELVKEHAPETEKTVALLGLSYKPSSHIVEESQSVMIAAELLEAGYTVKAYDPLATESAKAELGESVTYCSSAKETLKDADVTIITTDDPEFRELTTTDFTGSGKQLLVIDCWRGFEAMLRKERTVKYLAIGTSKNDKENEKSLKKVWNNPTSTKVTELKIEKVTESDETDTLSAIATGDQLPLGISDSQSD